MSTGSTWTTRRLSLAALILAMLAIMLPATTVRAAHIDLSFTTQPGDGTGGSPFSVQPVVHADNGGPVAGLAVTLVIRPQDNDVGGTLTCTGGTTVVTNGAGNAVFTGCEIDRAQQDYRLRASAPHADTPRSARFDVTVGPVHHLAFGDYPADPTPATLTPQPVVRVVDEGGNTVNSATNTITLSIDQNAGTFSCVGGPARVAVGGVASFAGCQQTTAGTDYNLTATTTGLVDNDVTGLDFDVVAAPTRLLLCWGATTGTCNTTPPTNSTGGVAFTPQPHVRIADAANSTVTSDDTTVVTLARAPGTPSSGGPGTLACTGGLSRTVTDGIAQFVGCTIDKAGTGYRLRATSVPTLTPADSNAFNVAVGPATRLGFLTQPTTGNAGQTLSPNITVAIQDAGGNTVTTGQSAAITLLITVPNRLGAVLNCSGGNTVAAVNGVATFTGCRIDRVGTFTLTATPGGIVPPGNIAPATSAPIVIAAPPAQIALFASSPVITWGDTVLFSVQFATNGANRVYTMQASPDGVNWITIVMSPLMTNAAGQGSFAYRPVRNYYYRAVFAGAPDLSAAMSNVQRVVVRQIALLRPTNLGGVDHVGVGTTIRFTATVRPARSELPRATVTFVVYRLIGRTWTLVATRNVMIDSAGLAAVDVTFSRAGKWYVRSIARPTTVNANSVWSPIERYDVP